MAVHSGYVLKPDWMLGGVSQGGLPERSPRQLQVTVFSAHVSQGRAMGFAKDDIYVELQVGLGEVEGWTDG
jgi:phosphatidylinositol phospholipase C delta